MNIETRVIKSIQPHICRQGLKVLPEHNLQDDLHADSLDLMEITMELESEFDIEIPDSNAEKMRTVSDWVKYIEARLEP